MPRTRNVDVVIGLNGAFPLSPKVILDSWTRIWGIYLFPPIFSQTRRVWGMSLAWTREAWFYAASTPLASLLNHLHFRFFCLFFSLFSRSGFSLPYHFLLTVSFNFPGNLYISTDSIHSVILFCFLNLWDLSVFFFFKCVSWFLFGYGGRWREAARVYTVLGCPDIWEE